MSSAIQAVNNEVRPPKAWERQYNESRQAFEAFRVYRDIGPGRSIREASEVLGKQHRLLEKWSAKWNWLYRIQEWERDQDRVRVEADREAVAEMSRRQAQIAVTFQTKLLERLINVNTEELTAADLARWFEVSVKVERLARGLPADTVRQEISGPGGGSIDVSSRYTRLQEIMANPDLRKKLELLSTHMTEIESGNDDVIEVAANGQ